MLKVMQGLFSSPVFMMVKTGTYLSNEWNLCMMEIKAWYLQ